MNASKNLASEMFTRTVVDRLAIDDLASRPGEAKLFFASLREVATLLLKEGDIKYLEDRLPFSVWQALKNDLAHRSVLWRSWGGESSSTDRDLQPEVLVTSEPGAFTPPPICTTPPDYPDCPPVRRRSSLGRGTEIAKNREEFLSELLIPTLDAHSPGKRKLSIYDPYLFQDVRRGLELLRNKNQLHLVTSIGLAWLLSGLSSAFRGSHSRPKVDIYTAEKDSDDYLDINDITEIWREVSVLFDFENVDVTVSAIGSYNRRILHLRGIYVNETRGFVLDRGLSDFNISPASSSSNRESLATKYHPQVRLSREAAEELASIRAVALKEVLT